MQKKQVRIFITELTPLKMQKVFIEFGVLGATDYGFSQFYGPFFPGFGTKSRFLQYFCITREVFDRF